MAFALRKTGEVKKLSVPVECMDQKPCRAAAEEAGHDAHREYGGAKRSAVDDQLGVEEHRGHHKGRQPVMAHALTGKRRGDRNGAVHAERRGDPQQAGRNNAEDAPGLALHPAEKAVNAVLEENGDKGADGNAQDPVPENLPELEIEIIPKIDKLPAENVKQITHKLKYSRKNRVWEEQICFSCFLCYGRGCDKIH